MSGHKGSERARVESQIDSLAKLLAKLPENDCRRHVIATLLDVTAQVARGESDGVSLVSLDHGSAARSILWMNPRGHGCEHDPLIAATPEKVN